MNYSKIIYYDSFNAKGLSTVLWVSGCEHYCKNCFNQSTWSFDNGELFTSEIADEIIESLEKSYIKNFVISGGDPLHPNNIKEIIKLCRKIRDNGIKSNIIIYTGYLIEELIKRSDFQELIPYITFVVDGPYKEELPTKTIDYRGSTNQRCIKVEQNLHTNEYILIDISDIYFKE